MPLPDVCVHPARVVEWRKTGQKIQGEQEVQPVPGQSFMCFLILPGAKPVENPWSRKVVTQPTILFTPFDVTGAPFELKRSVEVFITAPELTGPDEVKWYVDGDPEPFAKPGLRIGSQVGLRKTREGG